MRAFFFERRRTVGDTRALADRRFLNLLLSLSFSPSFPSCVDHQAYYLSFFSTQSPNTTPARITSSDATYLRLGKQTSLLSLVLLVFPPSPQCPTAHHRAARTQDSYRPAPGKRHHAAATRPAAAALHGRGAGAPSAAASAPTPPPPPRARRAQGRQPLGQALRSSGRGGGRRERGELGTKNCIVSCVRPRRGDGDQGAPDAIDAAAAAFLNKAPKSAESPPFAHTTTTGPPARAQARARPDQPQARGGRRHAPRPEAHADVSGCDCKGVLHGKTLVPKNLPLAPI